MQELIFLFMAFLIAPACGGSNGGEGGEDAPEDSAAGEGEGEEDAFPPDGTQDARPDTVEEDGPAPAALVAIFDDTAEPQPSAWPEGLDSLESAILESGFEAERLSRSKLNDSAFDLSIYRAIIFGGGYAYPGYTVLISADGKGRLRRFVEDGGVFMGVCAGAFFACDVVQWEGAVYDDESGYDTDLFGGTCTGPIAELATYPDWAPAAILFQPHPAVEAFDEAPFTRTLWYGAGPWFTSGDPAAQVMAAYDSEGIDERGEAALVTAPFGGGRVVLWGPHPEVRWDGASSDAHRLVGLVLSWALSE